MIRKDVPISVVLGLTIFFSFFLRAAIMDPQVGFRASGTINYGAPPDVTAYVNFANQTRTNHCQSITQINIWDWWVLTTGEAADVHRQYMEDAKFRYVRDYTLDGFQPCKSWNPDTQTGTWDWTTFDAWVTFVESIGAEPIITIDGSNVSGVSWSGIFPADTVSFGNYIAQFVRRVVDKYPNVEFFDLVNEAYYHQPQSEIFPRYFASMQVADAADHDAISRCKFSSDSFKGGDSFMYGFNRLLNPTAYGVSEEAVKKHVNWLSYHMSMGASEWPEEWDNDDLLISRAEYDPETGFDGLKYEAGETRKYSEMEMDTKWFHKYGYHIPIIGSEDKFVGCNTPLENNKNLQIVAAVWKAELTRSRILQTDGWGYGGNDYHWVTDDMTGYPLIVGRTSYNSSNPLRTWRYYANYLIGNNLGFGDPVFQASTSNFFTVSALAWRYGPEYKIMLVGKTKNTVKVALNISGLTPQRYSAQIIENTGDPTNIVGSITTKILLSPQVTLNGYSVVLITVSI